MTFRVLVSESADLEPWLAEALPSHQQSLLAAGFCQPRVLFRSNNLHSKSFYMENGQQIQIICLWLLTGKHTFGILFEFLGAFCLFFWFSLLVGLLLAKRLVFLFFSS